MPRRDDYVQLSPGRGKRLFLTRRAGWRKLLNLEQVIDYFRDLSFDIVKLHTHAFAEQVQMFSRSEVVVDVMGAGMTNAVFSRAGTNVIHLAPDGWTDPFYWNLPALKNQRFSIAFGRIEGSESPSRGGLYARLLAARHREGMVLASCAGTAGFPRRPKPSRLAELRDYGIPTRFQEHPLRVRCKVEAR